MTTKPRKPTVAVICVSVLVAVSGTCIIWLISGWWEASIFAAIATLFHYDELRTRPPTDIDGSTE